MLRNDIAHNLRPDPDLSPELAQAMNGLPHTTGVSPFCAVGLTSGMFPFRFRHRRQTAGPPEILE